MHTQELEELEEASRPSPPGLRGCLWGDGDECKSFSSTAVSSTLKNGWSHSWWFWVGRVNPPHQHHRHLIHQVWYQPCRMYRGGGGQHSHRVWSSPAVALLADDRCAEVLGVGERESVKCLQRREQKWVSVASCHTRNLKTEDWSCIPWRNFNSYKQRDLPSALSCDESLHILKIFHSWTSRGQYGTIHEKLFNLSTVNRDVRLFWLNKRYETDSQSPGSCRTAQYLPRSLQSDALLSGRERNASGSSHHHRQRLQRWEWKLLACYM